LIIGPVLTKAPTPTAAAGSGDHHGAPAQPELTTTVGAPPPNPPPASADRPVTIDAVVGQINGKPVIASEILEPLDGALRAVAVESQSASEWSYRAAQLIAGSGRGSAQQGELIRVMDDELVLSEARNSLTPEQRQGVRHVLALIQSNLISAQHGSEVEA